MSDLITNPVVVVTVTPAGEIQPETPTIGVVIFTQVS